MHRRTTIKAFGYAKQLNRNLTPIERRIEDFLRLIVTYPRHRVPILALDAKTNLFVHELCGLSEEEIDPLPASPKFHKRGI